MKAILSRLTRSAFALTVFLLTSAVLRWAPVFAAPPLDVRAIPLAGPAVVLGVMAALTGKERRPKPIRPFAVALGAAAALLALIVLLRGPAGLRASVSDARGPIGVLPPGPVDVAGPDLRELPWARKWSFRWEGPLRVPETGMYRLWADGRGRIEMDLDGRRVLAAEDERLRAGADLLLGRGEHRLGVHLQRTGPGPRLRVGWVRPQAGGKPGTWSEMIPPRYLGPPRPGLSWFLTDVLALVVAGLVALLSLVIPWDRPRRLPAPRPVTRAEIAWSLAGHALLVAIMSWPLVLGLGSTGVTDRPDGRLNAWILAWDVHALVHHPTRLFQAPVFHPLPDTLAFSENLLLPALLAGPALLLGGPVLGYNLALLGSLVVSGLGVQLLARRVSGGRLAAFVAGAIFAVGSHRWIRLAHLHAQVTLFLPLALLAVDRFWEKRTVPRALLVGLLLALQALSSIYLGAITALVLGMAVLAGCFGAWSRRDLLRLLTGFLLAGVLLAPLARPYLRMRALQGVEWTLADVANYATTLESYAAGGTRLYGGLTQRHLDPDHVQDTLFPGLVPLVLGIVGLTAAPRRYKAVALLASAAAIVVSLGPETFLYRFLHAEVVFVRGLRALSRFSLVPILSLAVLAGFALAGRFWLSLAALALALVEASNVPIRYAPYAGPSAAARWLAGSGGAVVYLPLGERDTEVMLDGVAHFRPLVNGDSGFMPRPYTRAMELLEGVPSDDAWRLLRAVGVRHVVTREPLSLPLLAQLGAEYVHELPAGEAAREVVPGRAAPTLWSREGILLDLGQETDLSRIAFELGEGPWMTQPRVAVSSDGLTWKELEAEASLADATLSLMRDPRHGWGEIRLGRARARYVRLDPRLPARPSVLWTTP